MVEFEASVEQPRQATEEAFDNAVPEASGAKQTSITDFFSPRATTSSVDVPRSSNTIRSFTLPPFITPCPSVRLAEVSAVFQVSECVAKDHFDPTRPLSEWGIPKSSVEVSSVETDPLPAHVGSETDADNEQYWIRQGEDRLHVIREMEMQLVETKAQLANMTTAFQMASDSSKEANAKALKAKADAESDKKSQQGEMESKIVCLESKIDFLESQLTDRCESETRLTRTLSRIADFDLWKDIEEEFNTQVSRADTLSEHLDGALSECYEWKGTYDELERNHQQLLENNASLENVLQMVQNMDLEIIRDLNGCLRQVFERMIRCSLLLEDEGYRPFDRKHRAVCEQVVKLTGHDYQQALIEYYKEHKIFDDFNLFADDDESEDEAGGQSINVGGHVGNSDYHNQANDEGPPEGLAEVHTNNLGVDSSYFVAKPANSNQDSSSAPGRFPQLAHAVAEPEEVQESPQISNVVLQYAVDVSEDRTWADLTVVNNAPYIVDMESYLESIPFRDMENTYWDDAEFNSRAWRARRTNLPLILRNVPSELAKSNSPVSRAPCMRGVQRTAAQAIKESQRIMRQHLVETQDQAEGSRSTLQFQLIVMIPKYRIPSHLEQARMHQHLFLQRPRQLLNQNRMSNSNPPSRYTHQHRWEQIAMANTSEKNFRLTLPTTIHFLSIHNRQQILEHLQVGSQHSLIRSQNRSGQKQRPQFSDTLKFSRTAKPPTRRFKVPQGPRTGPPSSSSVQAYISVLEGIAAQHYPQKHLHSSHHDRMGLRQVTCSRPGAKRLRRWTPRKRLRMVRH